MKRLLPILLCLCLCLGLAPALAGDVSAAGEDILTFEIAYGKATLTACRSDATGVVTVPDTYQGCPVTAIGSYAFYSCPNLTAIHIPASVTTAGTGAFLRTPADVIYDGVHYGCYSNNEDANSYGHYAKPVRSALRVNADGSLTRAECLTVDYYTDRICVEVREPNMAVRSLRQIPMELSIYGGIFLGDTYNYAVFGQENYEQDDSAEVLRIVKYSQDWERLGSASVYGSNTTIPFDAGSVRFAESGDMLLVRTSHEMYKSTDGYHHQANLTIAVNTRTMTVTDCDYRTWNVGGGYVSHSFNQFITVDGDTVLAADHGDAYPRSVVLIRYNDPLTDDWKSGWTSYVNVLDIVGTTGNNSTGVNVGGLEYSDTAYLVTGCSVEQVEGTDFYGQKNIFVTATAKDNFTKEGTTVHWLTNFTTGVEVGNPQLVKTGANSFLLLWMEGSTLRYTALDGSGNPVGTVYSSDTAVLSDCPPIVAEGKVMWYAANEGNCPVLYTIPIDDPGKLTATVNHVSLYTVEKAPTLTASGILHQTACLRCQDREHTITLPALNDQDYVCTVEKAPTCTEDGSATYAWNSRISFPVTLPALGHTWDEGVVTREPDANHLGERVYTCTTCGVTRAEILPPPGWENPFQDVPRGTWFYPYVAVCHRNDWMRGVKADTFSPHGTMTRAMAVAIIYRLEGEPEASISNPFPDVQSGRWFTDAILWATENGIVKGYTNGLFGTEDPVTREQFATILYRYAQFQGKDVSARADFSGFEDGHLVSRWARDGVSWAVAKGLLQGYREYGKLYLRPVQDALRCHGAALIVRFHDNILEQ